MSNLIYSVNPLTNNVMVQDPNCTYEFDGTAVRLIKYDPEYFKEFVSDLNDKSFRAFEQILCSFAKINYFYKSPEYIDFLKDRLYAV